MENYWVCEHGDQGQWHLFANGDYKNAACGKSPIPGMPVVYRPKSSNGKPIASEYHPLCTSCLEKLDRRSNEIMLANDVMKKLEAALGLSMNVNRVVIDLQAGCIARVVRVDYLTRAQADALAESLAKINPDSVV